MFGIKRTKADALFSEYVREKSDWSCERCRNDYHMERRGLHLSHFWSRRNRSVRFDRENVAALCFSCHRHFTENPYEHTEFFLKRLGKERFDALGIRARNPKKVDETEIALALKLELKNMQENRKFLK